MRRWSALDWLLAGVFLFAFVGLWWTPYAPGAQDFRANALSGPSAAHWLGIDPLGRDLFSRLWRGLGHTVVMAGSAAAGAFLVSTVLLASGERVGGALRRGIEGVVNLWVAAPVVLVGLLLLVVLRPSPGVLVLAAALGNVPLCFRQLRILWREQRSAPYVEASIALGARGRDLLWRTIWPNLRGDLGALLRLVFAIAALELSGLAFLGLIGDPDFPELGAILKQHQADLHRAPALVLWPGLWLCGLLALVHLSAPTKSGGGPNS